MVGKGENAGDQHFLLFPHNVFYPFTIKNAYLMIRERPIICHLTLCRRSSGSYDSEK